jgi:hypothetical protein
MVTAAEAVVPMVAMIQRPGRIKNATRDILPPRLATTGHPALDRAAQDRR